MRITQGMLTANSLKNLSNSYNRLGIYQDQLSTGKKITKPSDDPVVAMKGIHYRSNLTEIEQYKRNLSEAYLWMDNSETGIEQVNNALHRIRELTVQGKNGTLAPDDQRAVAMEIDQLKKDIVTVANSNVSGRFIFNGTNVDKAPVVEGEPPSLAADFNTKDYKVEVSRGILLKANVMPTNVFSNELFTTLQNIQDALSGEKPIEMLDQELANLDDRMDILSAERSELGARYNRLDMLEARIDQQEVMAKRIISDNEDAEIEKVITDLTLQESVHRAALSVGSRIIQPTLLDFLR